MTPRLLVHVAYAFLYGSLDVEGEGDEHLVRHVFLLLLFLPFGDLAPQLLAQGQAVQLALQRVLHVLGVHAELRNVQHHAVHAQLLSGLRGREMASLLRQRPVSAQQYKSVERDLAVPRALLDAGPAPAKEGVSLLLLLL